MYGNYHIPDVIRDIFQDIASSDATGWTEIITERDNPQFKIWINPEKLVYVCYDDGDVLDITFNDGRAFTAHINDVVKKHSVLDGDVTHIAAPQRPETLKALITLGLEDLIGERR